MTLKILLLLIPLLTLGYVYAQDQISADLAKSQELINQANQLVKDTQTQTNRDPNDPYGANILIEHAYGVARDTDTDIKNQRAEDADFINMHMLGTWHTPGGDIKIGKEDLDIIDRTIENYYNEYSRYDVSRAYGAGPSPIWKPSPLDVYVYVLIKYYWTYGVMVPPNEIESGMQTILGSGRSNSKSAIIAKGFLATYKVGILDSNSRYKTIEPPFLPAIHLRMAIQPPLLPAMNLKSILSGQTDSTSSNMVQIEADFKEYYGEQELMWLKNAARIAKIQTQMDENWRNAFDDWKRHDEKIQQQEDAYIAKRDAYREQLRAEGIASDTNMLLWRVDREL